MLLPDLSNVKVAALDTETYDPYLTVPKKGPGFLKQWGSYMIGFSYAILGGEHAYIPTSHSHGNYEGPWREWLKELCSDPNRILVFANAKYDIEVLWSAGITIRSHIVDIQTQEALLNENHRSYSLAAIADRRNLPAKGSIIIENALRDAGFVNRNKADWTRLKDIPLAILKEYAELDAALTLAIYRQQLPELEKAKLERVAKLESDLIPIFWDMRLHGVRVDIGKAEYLNFQLQEKSMDLLHEIVEGSTPVNPFATASLVKWLNELGFRNIPKTKLEHDSISNEWLEKHNHPMLNKMVEYRKGEKIRRDFVDALVLENAFDGKVHPQWFSTRGGNYRAGGDDYNGTRTGRPSCTDPNLTQIPARHPFYGPAVRGLFMPEGEGKWGKFDYSAQEPRITVHLAHALGLEGAAEVWQLYQDDPNTDYHQATADLITATTGLAVTRAQAKTVNLGLAYGMGKPKLARGLGLDLEVAGEFIAAYHQGLKFMRPLLLRCMDEANSKGWIKTSLGRRRHFNEWEKVDRDSPWEPPLADEDEARQKWGAIKRAGTYKALNAYVQGSAAEQTKTAMITLYHAGFIPLVQCYDELGYTIWDPVEVQTIKSVMEGVEMFTVPHVVDVVIDDTWTAK